MAETPMLPQDFGARMAAHRASMSGGSPTPSVDPNAPVAPPASSAPIKFSGKSPGGDDFSISIDFSPSTD